MDELLQLLNEYQESKWGKSRFYSYDHNSSAFIMMENPTIVLWEETILYKKFWFIEWLVINMKINIGKLISHWHIVKTYDLDEPWDSYGYVDSLLMLLAIQEDPINFLISILE